MDGTESWVGAKSPTQGSSEVKARKGALGRIVVTLLILVVCAWIGTSIVIGGLIAGLLTFGAVYTIATRVKPVNALMTKHPGACDVIATVATFLLLGGSVTGLVASAVVGSLFTLVLTLRELPQVKEALEKGIEKAKKACEAGKKESTR